MKRQPTYGEVLLGNCISDKRLVFQNIEFLKLCNKKINNSIKLQANDIIRHFTEEDYIDGS